MQYSWYNFHCNLCLLYSLLILSPISLSLRGGRETLPTEITWQDLLFEGDREKKDCYWHVKEEEDRELPEHIRQQWGWSREKHAKFVLRKTFTENGLGLSTATTNQHAAFNVYSSWCAWLLFSNPFLSKECKDKH